MSNALTARVWDLALPPTQKLLLLVLADMSSDDGPYAHACWPNVDRLAEKVGVTRVSIFTALKILEANGLLVRERRPGDTTIYHLWLPEESRS